MARRPRAPMSSPVKRKPITSLLSAARGRRVISVEERGPVTLVTLDRPERRNAVDGPALRALAEAPLCTIAAVEGAALGAGTQLAIACDLRVATPGARFGVPAARLGLMVDAPTVQRLAALVGGSVARSILLAADVLDGEAAARLGLVSRLGDLGAAPAWADEIAALAPPTV